MLRVNHISFSYLKNKEVISDISFDVLNGEVLVLLGPNGSGKSTIIKCLLGLNNVKGGEISIDDKDVKKMSYKDKSKLMAYVSQDSIQSSLTVFDVILLGRLPYTYVYESKEDIKMVYDIALRLNITHLLGKNINQISGGEKQKVLIAKALCQDTPIIIFDEPTNNLDITNQLSLMMEIKKIAKENNKMIIISMHDINLSLEVGTKFLMIKEGRIIDYGNRDIVNPFNIKKLFNVETKIIVIDGRKVVTYE